MALDITQVATLFGSSTTSSTTKLYDLVTGTSQNTSAALLNGLATQQPTGLTDIQSNAIASLQSFVQENVSGPEAEALFASIAALQQFLELGNEAGANLDPVFSLLAGGPRVVGDLPNGTLIDQLL